MNKTHDIVNLIEAYKDIVWDISKTLYNEYETSLKGIKCKDSKLVFIKPIPSILKNYNKSKDLDVLRDVMDINNTLMLDRKTNRLWKTNKIYLSIENKQYIFKFFGTNKIHAYIKTKLFNQDRTKFIKTRNNLK